MVVKEDVLKTESRYRKALILLLLVGAVVYIVQQAWQLSSSAFPIRSAVLQGKLENADLSELQYIVDTALTTGYLATDIQDLKRDLEADPWVKHALIERRWPDHLQIKVVEHVPYLRLGNSQLVSTTGVILKPVSTDAFQDLALLVAPGLYSEELFYSYREIEYLLLENDLELRSFEVNQFGSWVLNMAGDIKMQLGAEQQLEKFKRFIAIYTSLEDEFKRELTGIDLRYENGFVLGNSIKNTSRQ